MNSTQLKAHIFDAEQALTWARQAIEDGDRDALREALLTINAAVAAASNELLTDLKQG